MIGNSKIKLLLASTGVRQGSLLLFLFCWQLSCSIRAPEVHITRDQSALEKQLLGSYQQMADDSQMFTATATAARPAIAPSPDRRTVLSALQNQRFNKEIIDQYKRSGIMGENNRGLLEIRSSEKLLSSPELQKRVLLIVAEENRSRQIILARLLQIDAELAAMERIKAEMVLARYYADRSESGTWVQQEDDRWVKK